MTWKKKPHSIPKYKYEFLLLSKKHYRGFIKLEVQQMERLALQSESEMDVFENKKQTSHTKIEKLFKEEDISAAQCINSFQSTFVREPLMNKCISDSLP